MSTISCGSLDRFHPSSLWANGCSNLAYGKKPESGAQSGAGRAADSGVEKGVAKGV